MSTKILDEIFDVAPAPEAAPAEIITRSGEVIVPVNDDEQQDIVHDYNKTRSNLHTLLQSGQEALFHALEVAKQSEHPRAFEVVGNLVKQLADVNHQLLDLSEKKQKLLTSKTKTEQPTSTVTNNNAIFVGSTAELNKMLQNMTKGDK